MVKGIVCGVAINDSVERVRVGSREFNTVSTEYRLWHNMINRVYGRSKTKHYNGIQVCEDWLIFSNFKSWLKGKDCTGKFLDKDLLLPGNTVYYPELCRLVTSKVNTIISLEKRGTLPLGCCYVKRNDNYISYVDDSGRIHLGTTPTPEKAHVLWQNAKSSIIYRMAVECQDTSVSERLFEISSLIDYDLLNNLETIKINRKAN